MRMKIKKIACLLMALGMIWMTASCRVNDGSVTELSDPPGPQQTTPADPGSSGPSKPITTEPSDPAPSEPDVTEPDVSEPMPSDPVDPSGPADPTGPSEPDDPIVPSEPVHEHSYSEKVTEATCVEAGYTTYTCDCGDTYVDNRVSATGHSWGEWVTTKEPTEAATGTAERSCSECDEKESKVLDKIIPNHTHSYTGKVTTAATCTKEGVKTYTCSCGGSYTESVAKISHSYKDTVTKPTCTEKGYTVHKCSSCGDSYKDSYVNATGHSYSAYKSNGDATCTTDGTKTATCSNGCGTKDTKTDAGTALGHSYSKDSVVEPTLWSTGYTVYTCGRCSDSYNADHRELTAEEKSEFLRAVEAAVVKYVNQFREEQGDTPATALPGMQKVAQYRAIQLTTNFAHDTDDIRAAHAHFEYGRWVDATQWGDDESDSYWTANATEAIAYTPAGHYYDADIIGYDIANQIRGSSAHWSYVGASRLPFIAVGTWVMEHDGASFGGFYTCIMLSTENHG